MAGPIGVLKGGPVLCSRSDATFDRSVATSIAMSGQRSVTDDVILSAVEALLRTSYPWPPSRDEGYDTRGGTASWEIFRDDHVLDQELLRRSRTGKIAAAGQLHDRHHRLAYGIALTSQDGPRSPLVPL